MRKYPELMEEVRKTLLFLVEMDIKLYGKITNDTLEAIKTQGFKIDNNGIVIK